VNHAIRNTKQEEWTGAACPLFFIDGKTQDTVQEGTFIKQNSRSLAEK